MQFESIFKIKNDLFERVYDNENKSVIIRKVNTKPEYYLPHPNGQYRYILDESVRLKQFKGYPKYHESETYGKNNAVDCHIRDNYWSDDKSNYNYSPNMWFLDIETTAKSAIDVKEAREEVVLIQIWDTSKKAMIVLGSREWKGYDKYVNDYDFPPEKLKYITCNDELAIFNTLFKLLSTLKPLMVMAWNGNNFDYPFLFNRAEKLGLNVNRFSPFFDEMTKSGKYFDDVFAEVTQRKMDNGSVRGCSKWDTLSRLFRYV
jgi:DNA polymerase elongation subunit (family B)